MHLVFGTAIGDAIANDAPLVSRRSCTHGDKSFLIGHCAAAREGDRPIFPHSCVSALAVHQVTFVAWREKSGVAYGLNYSD